MSSKIKMPENAFNFQKQVLVLVKLSIASFLNGLLELLHFLD